MKYFQPDSGVIIKSWCDEPEEGAVDQANNLAMLPFAFKQICLMPDTHQGYGMPIGGVMATDDVIVPNAVGVDIGCLDKDTEFLSPIGWKKISEWDDDIVLQYDKFNDTASFVEPQRYIERKCDKFYHIKTKYGMDQMLSPDHKMLVWQGFKGRGYKLYDYQAEDFVKHHNSLKKGIQGGVKSTFKYKADSRLNLSDDEIRLAVMISADGCIRERKTVVNKVEVHLRKERKITRAMSILSSCGIKYSLTIGKDGSSFIYFDDNNYDKDLSIFWKADQKQLNIFAEEVLFWDGHIGEHEFYSTTKMANAEIVQFAFTVSGSRSNLGIVKNKVKKWKDNYSVYKTQNEIVGFAPDCVSKVNSVDGKAYCFTVPTGYFVARRNGFIFITGNCGMVAVKTSLTEIDKETLKIIMGKVRKQIPVGMTRHKTRQDIGNLSESRYISKQELPIVGGNMENALQSIGTLGGGNHFWECQKGDDGHIWIMIHSGSRNLGKQVADHYNKLAIELNSKWHSSVPKEWELAFFPIDDKHGQMYLKEMRYCVDFALANRKLMMDRSLEIIHDITGAMFQPMINIAHNYARMENHFGKNVLIHRKGATSAKEGEVGIIPGSQGTSSYIVKGKGNKDSFESCSHGAGRKMGRKMAEKMLNLEEERKRLDDQGIIHSIRTASDLDEASGAYKDIDTVMREQEDLVDIVVKLTPLGVIKG